MNKNNLMQVTQDIGATRNQVFVSTACEDKAHALRLIRAFERVGLNYWCMYNSDGSSKSTAGDKYTLAVQENLKTSCVVVSLISETTPNKPSTVNELNQVSHQIADGALINICPIYLNGMSHHALDYAFLQKCALDGLSPDTIHSTLDEDSTDEDYLTVALEIKQKYESCLFANIKRAWEKSIASRKFSSLLAHCSKSQCTSKTISDDIKESNELSSEKLYEAHILSNELLEYDCNTYSCMIIASNLLGTEKTVNGRKTYNPAKNGVKYFYYYPEKEADEVETTFKKIRGFIEKSDASRREVVSMIRREFSFRNKMIFFFKSFNGMTVDDFEKQYHVTGEENIEAFRQLFDSEDAQVYFDYAIDGDVFRLPGEMTAWLTGNTDEYTYEGAFETAKRFISFLERFVALLSTIEDVNGVSYSALKVKVDDLRMLKKLEEWQSRKISLSFSESKKLTTYLLGHSEDIHNQISKKYPRLASWMSFELDKDGNEYVSRETIEAAYNNLVAIPVVDDDNLKLCYSFILFFTDLGPNGAWYSTGYNETNKFIQNVVFTYNIDRHTDECDALVDAFEYLIKINPSAKAVLKKHGSQLVSKLIQENKK